MDSGDGDYGYVMIDGSHPAAGHLIAQAHEIGVQLLDRPFLVALFGGFHAQPGRQLVGNSIELAGPFGNLPDRL